MAQTYTPQQVADAMRAAGFPDSSIPTGVAVATAESGRRTVKSNVDPNSWGVWQINLDFWGKPNNLNTGISQGCALDLTCSTQAAYQISRGGTNWGPWSAFTSGSYLNFLNLMPSSSPSPGPPPAASVGPSPAGGPPTPSNVPSVASQVSGSGLFSAPLVGGLLQVSTKAVISVGLIVLVFVGMVKLVGGDPVKVAKSAAVAAK